MPARTRPHPAPPAGAHRPPVTIAADTETTDSAPTRTRLLTVSQWGDYYDWPPEGGLRHLIFHAETNGFASAFKRIGRRVLVDEAEFFRCVERANRKAA